MLFQSLGKGNDARCQPFCSVRLVSSHKGSYLLKSRQRPRRPDNLYRHSASSSCFLPQAHFGGGNSLSVPHESSQAFMSSCLT
jgi:hypothetical protein